MTSRLIVSISSALLFATLSFGASAAPKDAAANAKIEEAINVHYLATDFAKAEGQLLGVVKACGKDGCGPAIVGRAWMYIGLVRGSGKNDLAGARDAFNKAKAADGSTALDKALATPEVQGEFDAVFGEGAADAGGAGGGDGVAAMLAAAGGTAGECSPAAGGEIEIRRPIPLSCKAPAGAVKAVLAYKEFGGTQFANLPMTLQNGQFRSPIPCSATKMEGALLYVVVMKDAAGATVSTVGSLEQPAQLNIVKTTTQPPPAFPGEAPPARCAEEVECPPGMPGCTRSGGGGWGDSCTPAEPCKAGLFCASGTCENAPSCELDSDCDSGRCSNGFCDMGDSSSGGGGGGKLRKLWVGVHVAADAHFFSSGNDVCGPNSIGNQQYSCYYNQYPTTAIQDTPGAPGGIPTGTGQGGSINGGTALATIRVMASLDYAVIPTVTVGGRVGYAFNGGPPAANYGNQGGVAVLDPNPGKKFLPFHLELRGAYWFKSLGQPGWHPYVAVGGGLAQVDAKLKVQVADPKGTIYYADAYKRLGQGFLTVAPGAVFPLSGNLGVQVNLNLMYMLPVSGIVVEPSLGMIVGF